MTKKYRSEVRILISFDTPARERKASQAIDI